MTAIELATRFARSLDNEDYAAASECLAPSCAYEIAGKTHTGPDSIVASYRKSGDWARNTLDGIRYESVVRPGEHGDVVVEFTDHLNHNGISHTHRCEQHLKFDDLGRICSITHVDLSGEQEALDRFFTLAGLSRSESPADGAA